VGARGRCGVGLACVVAALVCAVAVQAFDQTALVTYLGDTGTYDQRLSSALPGIRRGVDGFVAGIRRHCAHLVPIDQSGKNAAVGVELGQQATLEFESRFLKPIARIGAGYTSALARLPWDTAKLGAGLAADSRRLQAIAHLRPGPNICSSIRVAKASGFTSVAPQTRRFVRRATPILEGSTSNAGSSAATSKALDAVLAHYMTPALRARFNTLQAELKRTSGELAKILVPDELQLVTLLAAKPTS
jgi:hypothetical protein